MILLSLYIYIDFDFPNPSWNFCLTLQVMTTFGDGFWLFQPPVASSGGSGAIEAGIRIFTSFAWFGRHVMATSTRKANATAWLGTGSGPYWLDLVGTWKELKRYGNGLESMFLTIFLLDTFSTDNLYVYHIIYWFQEFEVLSDLLVLSFGEDAYLQLRTFRRFTTAVRSREIRPHRRTWCSRLMHSSWLLGNGCWGLRGWMANALADWWFQDGAVLNG